MDLGTNYFGTADYALLIATLLVSLLIGLYHGYFGNRTNEDLLMGGRNLSLLPVAASEMVTFISAITILGFPSEVYAHGAQIYMMHLVSAFAFLISSRLLIPFFYDMKLTSVNEYLERRFDSKLVRKFASLMCILQEVLIDGVILYTPTIAMETFLGLPTWLSILGIGVSATIYTNVGGLKAVVWTDLFQCLMMIGGMVTICWKGISASGGISKAFEVASERRRMDFFEYFMLSFNIL